MTLYSSGLFPVRTASGCIDNAFALPVSPSLPGGKTLAFGTTIHFVRGFKTVPAKIKEAACKERHIIITYSPGALYTEFKEVIWDNFNGFVASTEDKYNPRAVLLACYFYPYTYAYPAIGLRGRSCL